MQIDVSEYWLNKFSYNTRYDKNIKIIKVIWSPFTESNMKTRRYISEKVVLHCFSNYLLNIWDMMVHFLCKYLFYDPPKINIVISFVLSDVYYYTRTRKFRILLLLLVGNPFKSN